MDLLKKKCVPCEGNVPPLAANEIEAYKAHTPGWAVINNNRLERVFMFDTFQHALDFINTIGALAEKEGHHPDINLYGWNKVRFTLSTHAIGGLSENDFILAAKINNLAK